MKRLCATDALGPGEARSFRGEALDDDIFVVRQGDAFFAYRDLCPHYGTTRLAYQRDRYLDKSGLHIVCAAHGARFRIADGVCVSGPCEGQRLESIAVVPIDSALWIFDDF